MEKLKVETLKKLLRNRGGSTRGRKADLIERLEAYKRNDNFEVTTVVDLPAVNIPDWPEGGYRQLSPDHLESLPLLHYEHISHYFMHRQGSEKSSAKDVKSIEKGKDLLASEKVNACSYVRVGDFFYFSGIVKAAMKKNVSYNYKVKFNMRGEVVNTHCECPGGKGPHGSCKHVAAVCLMLVNFKETGELATNESCTDRLQVFHHPLKKYTGSPVKGENLKVPSKCHTSLEDPRPVKRRKMEGWGDFVRSQTINFCYEQDKTMACSYLWSQADINTAMFDHDYLCMPFVEYWIDQYNQVDDVKIRKIESETRGQSNCAEWHEQRAWRITASFFGTVTHLSARRNIPKLCSNMLNSLQIYCKPILHGMQYEPIAIKKFTNISGKTVHKCGLFVSKEYFFLAATPDGIIDESTIIEVKCPYAGQNEKISATANFPFLCMDTNGNLQLKKNHKYFDQIQGQLFISKRRWCFLVVYTFCDVKLIRVAIDDSYCDLSLIPKLQCFYQKYYRPFIAQNIYK